MKNKGQVENWKVKNFGISSSFMFFDPFIHSISIVIKRKLIYTRFQTHKKQIFLSLPPSSQKKSSHPLNASLINRCITFVKSRQKCLIQITLFKREQTSRSRLFAFARISIAIIIISAVIVNIISMHWRSSIVWYFIPCNTSIACISQQREWRRLEFLSFAKNWLKFLSDLTNFIYEQRHKHKAMAYTYA